MFANETSWHMQNSTDNSIFTPVELLTTKYTNNSEHRLDITNPDITASENNQVSTDAAQF